MRAQPMSDTAVERALGYTPCVCGVLDGTWHSKCYRNKTSAQINAGYKLAFAAARRHLLAAAAGDAKPATQGEKT